jgi:alkanesulfonate monooxygenase SsuD/methylene tetrahydromethanopterin reductase-like flavin-dependent oxidoreductase (luciferase family)
VGGVERDSERGRDRPDREQHAGRDEGLPVTGMPDWMRRAAEAAGKDPDVILSTAEAAIPSDEEAWHQQQGIVPEITEPEPEPEPEQLEISE